MKQFILLMAGSACFMNVSAQRVDLDRYHFTASYRDLPRHGLDTAFKTFTLVTALSPSVKYSLEDEHPEDRIGIPGLKRVPYKGHLSVTASMEDVIADNAEVKERTQVIRDKSGKEMGRKYFYYTELQYSFACEARVTDFRGAPVSAHVIAGRHTKRTYRTQEYASHAEAMAAFVNNAFSVTANVVKLEVNRSMNELAQWLSSEFGCPERSVTDYLWILDSKKHPEYKAHLQAWNSFRQAMFHMRADEPLDEVREMLMPSIRYFESLAKRYHSDSKADRKIRYASYYNLAKIFYYLDEADGCMREAGKLMTNDYDEKDGRALEALATELKQLLRINHTHTRHFPVEGEVFEGSAIVSTGW